MSTIAFLVMVVTIPRDLDHKTCVMVTVRLGQLSLRMWSMGRRPDDLNTALAEHSERLFKPKLTVLFRRGQAASGLYIVHSGTVSLDFGVDSPFAHPCGAGSLVGLPATLTGRPYSMTATVIQDAELGFCPPERLHSLLSSHPDFCEQLLLLLGEKAASTQQTQKALLRNDRRQPRAFRVMERECFERT